MVYLSTLAQVRAAYQHLVGKANYVSHDQTPDALRAIQMAQLQPGESVLDLGCAGGKIAALAKQAVGSGLVVGLDGVPGFLAVDATAHLASHGLTVAPAGDPAQRVHLVKGNITDGNISKHLALMTGEPACYNVIFLVHVFETIPPEQRCSLLKRLKGLLTPGGRIVISMSARFTNEPIASLELQIPVQFRPVPHTEAVGSVLVTTLSPDLSEATADGAVVPARIPSGIVQTAPRYLWDAATKQAQAAAAHVGLRLVQAAQLGAHDFGLIQVESVPPPPPLLAGMTALEIATWMDRQDLAGRQDWSQLFEALACRSVSGWTSLPQARCDFVLVNETQQYVAELCGGLQERAKQMLKGGQRGCSMAAHNQVAVLVELRV
ncbi:hypothetical protein N0V87_010680 [Didymella glomerata]|uniref:Methyltransferase domain-containing protein n=1 Tax=Didymella glomerata TaxID=749621 RepID=A0A9W8WNV1_9PLEO|nr:hypothetical protein N0V87_010680 [Didymella glomerata]